MDSRPGYTAAGYTHSWQILKSNPADCQYLDTGRASTLRELVRYVKNFLKWLFTSSQGLSVRSQ